MIGKYPGEKTVVPRSGIGAVEINVQFPPSPAGSPRLFFQTGTKGMVIEAVIFPSCINGI
jgi:hypothetical protein